MLLADIKPPLSALHMPALSAHGSSMGAEQRRTLRRCACSSQGVVRSVAALLQQRQQQ